MYVVKSTLYMYVGKVHYTCMLLKVHYTCMLVKYIIHVCCYGRYMLALGHEGPYNKYQNMF
jgi:hypothetical protein